MQKLVPKIVPKNQKVELVDPENKILYINVFQPFAQYRNPFTFSYAQTFPLPPKSTIVGMLQNATGDYYNDNYNNLQISVHGVYQDIFWHYQHFIKGTPRLEVEGEKLVLKGKDGKSLYYTPTRSQRSPRKQQEIFNIRLHIFIKGNEEIINKINDALRKPRTNLYLGRSEDLIFIRKGPIYVEKINETEILDKKFNYGFYLYSKENDIKFAEELRLPTYYLPTQLKFELENRQNVGISKSVILSMKVKNNLKRYPGFRRAYYVDCQTPLIFKEKEKFEVLEIEGESFYIHKKCGWV